MEDTGLSQAHVAHSASDASLNPERGEAHFDCVSLHTIGQVCGTLPLTHTQLTPAFGALNMSGGRYLIP